MANAPIIQPSTGGGTPATPFGVGVPVVGGVANALLFCDGSSNVAANEILTFLPSGLLMVYGNSQVSNSLNFRMETEIGKQKFFLFNENGADIWAFGTQVDGTIIFFDAANSVVCATVYPHGGFAPTKLTTSQKNSLTAVEGMIVYDTTLHKLSVYTGAAWETVTSI